MVAEAETEVAGSADQAMASCVELHLEELHVEYASDCADVEGKADCADVEATIGCAAVQVMAPLHQI
ncbi:hypothetical protein B296_00006269, partial [Ensete ventricosum]